MGKPYTSTLWSQNKQKQPRKAPGVGRNGEQLEF